MRFFFVITASAAALGGLYAGGVFPTGEVYDLTAKDVRAKLLTLTFPPDVLDLAGGTDSQGLEVSEGPDSIRWKALNGGPQAPMFSVTFRSEGPVRTRVTVDYTPRKSDNEADRIASTKFFRSYAESSFAEVVDARLDGRPIDLTKARHDFAMHAANHPELMAQLGRASKEAFEDVNSRAVEMSRTSLEAEQSPQSTRDSMTAATRPSVDLPDQN